MDILVKCRGGNGYIWLNNFPTSPHDASPVLSDGNWIWGHEPKFSKVSKMFNGIFTHTRWCPSVRFVDFICFIP